MTRRVPPAALLAVTIGVIGWGGLAVLGLSMALAVPPKAGFDLSLILAAGQRVAHGSSPYAASLLDGSARIDATDLFFSYPPPLAQLASLVPAVPLAISVLLFGLLAVVALFAAVNAVASSMGTARPHVVALVTVAVAAFVFPFSIAVLFSNVDAFYPFAFGLLVAWASSRAQSLRLSVGVGLALGAISVAKIHPALAFVWLIGLAVTGNAGTRRPAAVAVATGAVLCTVVVALSLLAGGMEPWLQYTTALATISGANLVVPNNVAPAAVVAGVLNLGESGARVLQVGVVAVGVLATVWAVRLPDRLEGAAWAITASLVVLPVTWFHYPAALIPVLVAAALRARARGERDTFRLVGSAALVSILSIAAPPLVWLSVVLGLAAVRRSATGAAPSASPTGLHIRATHATEPS